MTTIFALLILGMFFLQIIVAVRARRIFKKILNEAHAQLNASVKIREEAQKIYDDVVMCRAITMQLPIIVQNNTPVERKDN